MKIDIQTSSLEPRRQTYAHIARRFGQDRPASRYEEAVLDVQATNNFHYRPLWAPEFELYDTDRTQVKMKDWYDLRDPRQFYYGTYNISRAGMEQVTNTNFDFVEKRDLLATLGEDWRQMVYSYLVPMRHFEWGANMNNWTIADFGYGAAITSAASFCAADRLGMAQILSRIGLALDDNSGASLDVGKKAWLDDVEWQGVRHAIEDTFVLEDWFETFVAQNVALDGVMHPLVFGKLDETLRKNGGVGVSMLCEFMTDWFPENSRWVDAVVKTAAAESAENKALIEGWAKGWIARATEAALPIAKRVAGDDGEAALQAVTGDLQARLQKLGLEA